MLDLSEEPDEENIATCVKYFKRMAKMGIWLEMEIGKTGGEEDGVKHSGTIDEIAEKTNPARTVQVHLTEPFDGIDACLKDFPVVSSVHTVDEDRKRLEFIHDGTSQDEAEVLASLVGKGAKIYRFEPKQSKVEDLFLQVESGEGQGGNR